MCVISTEQGGDVGWWVNNQRQFSVHRTLAGKNEHCSSCAGNQYELSGGGRLVRLETECDQQGDVKIAASPTCHRHQDDNRKDDTNADN